MPSVTSPSVPIVDEPRERDAMRHEIARLRAENAELTRQRDETIATLNTRCSAGGLDCLAVAFQARRADAAEADRDAALRMDIEKLKRIADQSLADEVVKLTAECQRLLAAADDHAEELDAARAERDGLAAELTAHLEGTEGVRREIVRLGDAGYATQKGEDLRRVRRVLAEVLDAPITAPKPALPGGRFVAAVCRVMLPHGVRARAEAEVAK